MSDDGRAQQRALYGEPLADIAARVQSGLGLTQARLAELVGLSAPMLSQLIAGNRVKIGNPAVLHRLQALIELAAAASGLSPAELDERLRAIRDEQPTLTGQRTAELAPRASLIAALAQAAPAAELARVATLTTVPALAALLNEAAARRRPPAPAASTPLTTLTPATAAPTRTATPIASSAASGTASSGIVRWSCRLVSPARRPRRGSARPRPTVSP